jgi:hypothetical protein
MVPEYGVEVDLPLAASHPSRILVYGATGSGKTTLARQIGERLGLPWHSVDDLTWESGWVQVPTEVQRTEIAAICAQKEWAGYGVRRVGRSTVGGGRSCGRSRLPSVDFSGASAQANPDPAGQTNARVQRQRRVAANVVVGGLHRRVAFQVVQAQTTAHAPVAGRSGKSRQCACFERRWPLQGGFAISDNGHRSSTSGGKPSIRPSAHDAADAEFDR